MGSTVLYQAPTYPHGNPGIDFLWSGGATHKVRSSSAGVVRRVVLGATSPGKWDVEVASGVYLIRYKELESSDVYQGSTLKAGSIIGYAGKSCVSDDATSCNFRFHWELASRSLQKGLFCPAWYLDSESSLSLTNLWASIPLEDKQKSSSPNLCNGVYANRAEPLT
jgi:hypothetical protein